MFVRVRVCASACTNFTTSRRFVSFQLLSLIHLRSIHSHSLRFLNSMHTVAIFVFFFAFSVVVVFFSFFPYWFSFLLHAAEDVALIVVNRKRTTLELTRARSFLTSCGKKEENREEGKKSFIVTT